MALLNEKLLDELPVKPAGEWITMTDSHDVTGFNNDGFQSTYSYLYRNDEGLVLFERIGSAGCIREIRTIGYTGRLKIYIDGEDMPQVDISFDELYSGADSRFPPELACDEVRGHGSAWCYAPIPFERSCRVVATDRILSYHFYNVFAHLYNEDHVVSREGTQGSGARPAGGEAQNVGGRIRLESFKKQVLLERQGSGTIREITLRIPEGDRAYAMEHVRLRMRWDPEQGKDAAGQPGPGFDPFEPPAVDAPLGLFFATGYSDFPPDPHVSEYTIDNMNTKMIIPTGRVEAAALPVGERDGAFYCRFPMPFKSGALIELANTSDRPVDGLEFTLTLDESMDLDDCGRFYAFYHREDGTVPHRDYRVLDVRGCGKYVGCVMRMSSRGFDEQSAIVPRIYLEGDARFYIDDARGFLSGSTGTEEYFNWGWYDMEEKDRVFAFPTHGYPEHVRRLEDHTTMYRFHITDYIPYYRSFRFEMEHGPEGQTLADYSSVAFYYHSGRSSLVLADELDVGDIGSERDHQYAAEGLLWSGAKTMVYEGGDQVLFKLALDSGDGDWRRIAGIKDTGRTWTAGCAFTAAIPPGNRGVKIRRRYDGEFPEDDNLPGGEGTRVVSGQQAAVYVDECPVGLWHLPAHHARDCWMEDEFEIPARLTAGKDSLRIRLETPEGRRWNEYRYWIFAYRE